MEEEKKEEGEGEKQQKIHEGGPEPEPEAEAKEEEKSRIKEKEDKELVQKGEDDRVVLKVNMHCEACARKVVRALNGFQGVEDVRADYKASRVVVKGKGAIADPVRVSQRIQKKTGRRKVEIISPLPNPPSELPKEDPPKQHMKEQEPPPVAITVVLKVQMHCEACAQVMQKRIRKVKGVELVTADIANNEVTVKGVIDPDKLVIDVYKRTRKHASLVKNEEKKDEEKNEKSAEEKKQVEEQSKEEDEVKEDIKRAEHWPSRNYLEYAYAPQMFSDENPNACSVM